ncbi:MAG: hypothetical protein J5680_03755, partial [Neisseriaceae bacterium]|nr:hypothetical protein [Neisseriaceae bacterium]
GKITDDKFSKWRKLSPKLSENSYCYTYRYVKDEKNKDTDKIKDELKDIEFFLDKNQTIFHGGIFPSDSPKIGDEITTMEIFSTTIDPFIASHHAIQEKKAYLWIIKLNQKTKCLPVNTENMGTENEIIIIDSLKLKITNITSLSEINEFGIEEKMDCIFLEQI